MNILRFTCHVAKSAVLLQNLHILSPFIACGSSFILMEVCFHRVCMCMNAIIDG